MSLKISYETEFRIKEKEYYPRSNYSHDYVINELANIVKEADNRIEDLQAENYGLHDRIHKLEEDNQSHLSFGGGVTILLLCSLIVNIIQAIV